MPFRKKEAIESLSEAADSASLFLARISKIHAPSADIEAPVVR
jgi:hypothetical protein